MWRSRVPPLTALGFSLAPLACGLFIVIVKDPAAARSMGLITTKAQLLASSADWPSYFKLLAQVVAVLGMIVFAILTSWVFGREFSDHTVKELLALPTPREAILAAKFIVIAVWSLAVTCLILLIGLIVGWSIVIPGWSLALLGTAMSGILGTAALTLPLMSFVAFAASAGRGYLPAFGWIMLTVFFANLAVIIGWGDWFPWSLPGLFSPGLFSSWASSSIGSLGLHSYVLLFGSSVVGLALTFRWWRSADQTR